MKRSASISLGKIADLVRRLWSIQFLRFLLVGGINTLFGYGVFALLIILNHHFKICSPEVELVVAPLISHTCGVLFNFKTYGTLVFGNKNNRLILRFFGVYCITYVLTYGLLRGFDSLGVGRLVAGAIIILPVSLVSFTLNRRFVFSALDRTKKPGS